MYVEQGFKKCQCEILEKLWDWAKELKLKLEELRNEVMLTKTNLTKWPGTRQLKRSN
jgi:hypothetical protein